MSFKSFVKDYLLVSKKERSGALFLVILGLAIIFLPRFFSKSGEGVITTDDSALMAIIDTIKSVESNQTAYEEEGNSNQFTPGPSLSSSFINGELFTFDPNHLDAEGWKRLGLNDRTIKTLLNYRTKGGKFYKPEDVKKIWGLPPAFYNRIAPYIQIAGSRNISSYKTEFPKTAYSKSERKISAVPINEADTGAFIALPGIGAKLAFRIVNFRDKLGGFYSIDQLRETYGLPDSTFQKIKPYLQVNPAVVKKININTATKDELKAHPYIRWNIANVIVEYRAQHGPFKNLDELKNIVLIDDALFTKLSPYLTL